MDLVGAGLRVPLVQGGHIPYCNLDYAASAPCLQAVADRVGRALPWYASVHRGAGLLSEVSTAAYEGGRATVAQVVSARPDDVVVFTRNTTDALNLLARSLPESAKVLVMDVEHHANLLPWQRRPHRVIVARPSWSATLSELRSALAETDFSLLAVTGASNVTGETVPLAEVAEAAHDHGARVVIDGAQLLPHRPISLSGTGVDYLAFSAHKCYAPFGSGALVGRRDWLDEGIPYLAGGGAVLQVGLDGAQWRASPERHEAGTPNVIGVIALDEALKVLSSLDPAARLAHEDALRCRLEKGLGTLPGVRPLRVWDDKADAVGITAFTVDGHDTALIATYLACEHGTGVREGRFCAHPLVHRINQGAGVIRASYGLGSTIDDIDRLVMGLAAFLDKGPTWEYARSHGSWAPVADRRPRP